MTDLKDRFDALGPWYTRFDFEGESLVGEHSYADDYRIPLFFEWLGERTTILELSSFEGGHSLRLAKPNFVERLLGLEGRPELIERAELAVEVLGRGNIEMKRADLDKDGLEHLGKFDAVFCAGLLYHLTEPWRLIAEIGKVTDNLFLDTHFSDTEQVRIGDYVGSWHNEGGYSDPLSGLSESSFWMTLPCLKRTIGEAGLVVRHEQIVEDWAGSGPRVHLAATRE
jgi:SAM-dependent methyltransferase